MAAAAETVTQSSGAAQPADPEVLQQGSEPAEIVQLIAESTGGIPCHRKQFDTSYTPPVSRCVYYATRTWYTQLLIIPWNAGIAITWAAFISLALIYLDEERTRHVAREEGKKVSRDQKGKGKLGARLFKSVLTSHPDRAYEKHPKELWLGSSHPDNEPRICKHNQRVEPPLPSPWKNRLK